MVLSIRSGSAASLDSPASRPALCVAGALALRSAAAFAALAALLVFALPVQADEIEPEPEPEPAPQAEPEPEPEPEPDVVPEDTEPAEPRWIPSIETGFETFDYNVDTTVVNHITQPLSNPNIVPGVWGGTQNEAERQLMFRIGGELMGPMFEDLPGRPRLFIKGGAQIRTWSSDKIFSIGDPSIAGEPEQGFVLYRGGGDRGLELPRQFVGQGSEISGQFQDPSWYAGLGVAFSVPIATNLLVHIKPSVQYSMEKIDLPGSLTTALETTPPGTPPDPTEKPFCGLPSPPRPACARRFTAIRSRTEGSTTDHSVGLGLEIAMVPFRRTRPIRVSIYAEARFLWLVSDDTTEFSDPNGVASYSVVRDDFNIKGGGGLRFSWVGFD